MILISLLLLSGVIAGIWLWPPHKNISSASLPVTSPDHTPAPNLHTEESALESLPAISPEMAAAIRELSNHSTEGLKETVNADGSITLNHEDHLQSVMVGVKGPDGKIYIRHGEDFLQNVETQ